MLYTTPACVALFVVLVILGSIYCRKTQIPFMGIVVVSGFICFCIGSLSAGILRHYVPRQLVTNTYTLAAMHTTSTPQGSFVWGSGSLGGVMKYDVYVKNDNGSVSPYRISANDNVEIIENADLKDVGYWKRTVRKFDYSTTPLAHWVIQSPEEETLIKTELVVPVGTVLHNFAAQ
ncbi:MAG: hypothetical protein P4L53_05255 [Candidatus Obscuribacterales bacterium]|nr:hypothetical protein [Candidatus Obscuribacterales bacterium]